MIYIRDARSLRSSKERNSLMTIGTAAFCGFSELGDAVTWFTDVHAVCPTREDTVIGSIGDMLDVFDRLGVRLPYIEYPDELRPFFGRDIWVEPSLAHLIEEERTGIFIKPAEGMKRFTGRVIRRPLDYDRLSFREDLPVVCSPIVPMASEWRCYIRYGRLLAMKHYAGDPFVVPRRSFVEEAVRAYRSAPAGYAMDVAVLDPSSSDPAEERPNIVVEINDGYSLGVYGIAPLPYAKLLAARYAQLVGAKDPYADTQ